MTRSRGVPPAFLALTALLLALFLVPLLLLVPEVAPGELAAQIGSEGLRRAVGVSLLSATLSTALLAAAGVPAGYVLARAPSRLAWGARAAVLLPTVLPPVAAGVLLLNVVGPAGVVGRLLEGGGWTLVNAFGGIVLSQLFVAAPFVVLSSEAAFRAVDPVLESAAATLGATRAGVFRRVALPLARTGVLAGLALAWMRAVGEFGATVVLAYHPHSLPVYLWLQLTGRGLRAALPVAAVALAIALAALAAAQLLLRRRPLPRAGGGVLRGPARAPEPEPGPEPEPSSRVVRAGAPVVDADLRWRVGDFALAARLEAGEGVLSLFGPSGAGKSSLLRLLAGLERPDGGRLRIDGVTVFASGAEAPAWTPPHRRPVGLVFQSDALFPHLTAAENVLFGAPPGAGREALRDLLRLTRLEGLEGRRPAELSGGQRQRVALARSLIRRPRLLLLDEPFSSLDANMRERLHGDVRRIAGAYGLCVIYVTHELRDACTLADRLAVMAEGRVLQTGDPLEVLRRPATYDVARFVGTRNLISAWVAGAGSAGLELRLPGGFTVRCADRGSGGARGTAPAGLTPGAPAWLCVRPEDIVLLKPDRPLTPPADQNVIAGRVAWERLRGATYTLGLVAGPGEDGERLALEIELPVRSYEALGLASEKSWRVSLRASVLHVLPAESDRG